MTTRGRRRRRTAASLSRLARVFSTLPSGEIEGFAVGYVEDAGGCVRFCFAVGAVPRVPDSPWVRSRMPGAPATGVHGEECAAAGLFDVVAVGGDGEDVDGRCGGHRDQGSGSEYSLCFLSGLSAYVLTANWAASVTASM